MTDKTLEQRAIEERARKAYIERPDLYVPREEKLYNEGVEDGYKKGATDQESRHLLTVEQEKEALQLLREAPIFRGRILWYINRNNFLSTITKQETKQ